MRVSGERGERGREGEKKRRGRKILREEKVGRREEEGRVEEVVFNKGKGEANLWKRYRKREGGEGVGEMVNAGSVE